MEFAISNPFTPQFGAMPKVLVGRDQVLADVRDGLLEGVGSPFRSILVQGPRGSGKTVLLGAARSVALEEGWLSVHVTTAPDLLDNLLDQTRLALTNFSEPPKRNIKGITIGPIAVATDLPSKETFGWRVQMAKLIETSEQHGSGILFTIDEVHADEPSLRKFAQHFQEFVNEGRQVSVVLAGLNEPVDELVQQVAVTFLTRAERELVGAVSSEEVEFAISETLMQSGRKIEADALSLATAATRGFPFLIQLFGYYIWRAAGPNSVVNLEHVKSGISAATNRLGRTIHAPALRALSETDQSVLIALSTFNGAASTGELANALNKQSNYLAVYRKRLLESGLIIEDTRGRIDFAYPYMRDYLRDHTNSPNK